ncbi:MULTISPECIES: helix-turn-helix transcriptional regulator [Bacteria]|uniref:helix-turn-helix transcriptional regulator n=1 Tax=Bacteria TaxID=2 RepID=UPI003C7BFD2E
MLITRAVRAVAFAERAAGAEGQRAIAPHVAGEIARLGDLDDEDLGHVFRALSTAQLRGMAVLPAALPLSPALRDRHASALEAAGSAGRRLLLTAALSTSDRFDVVLAAAAIDPAVLLTDGMGELLSWNDGRFRFVSPAARAAVLQAPRSHRDTVHRALARAHRRRGETGREAWHAVQLGGAASGAVAELARFGRRLLAGGSADAAYRVGRLVAGDGDGGPSASGRLLMGRAAAALGCFEEAVAVLRSLDGTRQGEEAAGLRDAIDSMLHGALPAENGLATLLRLGGALRQFEATRSDHEALHGMAAILAGWGDDDEVDGIQARLMATTVGARPAWPWRITTGPLSPIIEAQFRGQQAVLLLLAGEPASAAATLRDALLRLPMTHFAGGLMTSVLRVLRHTAPDLWGLESSFALVRPASSVQLDLEYELRAPRITAIAARLTRAAGMRAQLRSRLTARENEIVDLVGEGMKNREIGARLGIAGRTVEIHLGRIFRKIGIGGRSELIALVLRDRAGRGDC